MSESKELASKVPEVAIVNLSGAKEAMDAFQKFKREVLTSDDVYTMNNKQHVRKSGWMKYAMALGINTEVYDEKRESMVFKGEDVILWSFTGRATAGNGRYAVAVGSASSDEGKPWCDSIHSIRAMAQTRAVERAISNLVGGGEIGAEELDTRNPKSIDATYETKDAAPSRGGGYQPVTIDGIYDTLSAAGLDPKGVEVVAKDHGKFIVKPAWSKSGDREADKALWQKYNQALFRIGAKYRGGEEPNAELRYNWTVGWG